MSDHDAMVDGGAIEVVRRVDATPAEIWPYLTEGAMTPRDGSGIWRVSPSSRRAAIRVPTRRSQT